MAKAKKDVKDTEAVAGAAADKKKALETAIAHINKTMGQGAVMRLGENAKMQVSAVSTGSITQ